MKEIVSIRHILTARQQCILQDNGLFAILLQITDTIRQAATRNLQTIRKIISTLVPLASLEVIYARVYCETN